MTKKQLTVITGLSIAVLAAAMLLSQRIWFRLDLTKNKAYTISEVSRRLYLEIPDQVQISYYLSDKLAAIHPLPSGIDDLLREYAAHSRGRIRYIRKDPAKAGITREVEQLGILPQQMETVEQDQASVVTIYSGILIEYLDKAEVLPLVLSLDTLEYDITSRIRGLVKNREREAGVITGDAAKQWERDFAALDGAFRGSGFRVRLITAGDEIPDTLPMLFVLGGAEDLDDWALYRIDRYIQGGGRVFFALDGVHVDSQGSLEARPLQDKGLLAMLASYGAVVEPLLLLDRTALTLQYQTLSSNGTRQIRITRYPHWVGTLADNASPTHPVTARFRGLDLYWPSPITLKAPPGVEADALISSTPGAWLMTRNFNVNPDMPEYFDAEAEATRGTRALAVCLSGIIPSRFAGQPKPVREGSEETLPDLPALAKSARIIVVGDTDFASNMITYTQSERNLDFILQAADWLGNDEDIIGIRNRESAGGRLDRIADPRQRALTMNFARILNTVIIPLAVISLGFFLAWNRRRRFSVIESNTPAQRETEKQEHSDGV
ncbi:MAG: GldG family protein [Treponema sp.]|jgi:ABC-type uncharacterized transport system involved in gliding motility auxiliary subunit|nr:GldG family protein [Treponema sp.]